MIKVIERLLVKKTFPERVVKKNYSGEETL